MSMSNIGKIIYWKRVALGLSQEDLADGVCSVPTLSRIENGERIPTQNHLELLLQRLGYTDLIFDTYADEEALLAHELKFRIRQTYIEGDYAIAKELLSKFEPLAKKVSQIDRQFILLMNIILYPEKYSAEERLQKLEEALYLTQPKYRTGYVPRLLSYEEIIILNNIAVSMANCGRRKSAIDTLYGIMEYYDTHITITEEALRTEPMTLYNLSKYLGLENRYDECIAVCEKGILLAKRTGRCPLLAHTMYNEAWALVKRNQPGDFDTAKELAHMAFQLATMLGNTRLAKHCNEFILTNHLQ